MTDEFEDLALLNAAYADDEAKRLDARFAKLLNIPAELRAIPQWMFAGADKAPHTLRDGRTVHGSVSKPDDWMTFDAAVAAARVCNGYVGFVFTKGCGFTVLDVDVKNSTTHPDEPRRWTPPDVMDSLWSYVQKVSSYTERSRSGWGLHVLVRGDIGPGIHSQFLEVYSQDRFMICTGNRLQELPEAIEDRDDEVKRIAEEYRKRTGALKLVDLPPCTVERRTDSEVMDWLRSWSNAAQFERLWAGDIPGYPSQSEADAALMNFLWKATEDKEQVFRLFRESKLGGWDIRRSSPRFKAHRNDDYLNRTLTFVVSKLVEEAETLAKIQIGKSLTYEAAQADRAAEPAPSEPMFCPPPGRTGRLMHEFYCNSKRPNPEVATMGAFGWLAGLCGRACETYTGADLALYLLLVAKSRFGKDALHDFPEQFLQSLKVPVIPGVPLASTRLRSLNFSSGTALLREVAKDPGFCVFVREFGVTLEAMATARPGDAMASLRGEITTLYNIKKMGGKAYADRADNIPETTRPALSIIGETTPGRFEGALTRNMMEEGFMARFLCRYVTTPRGDENNWRGNAMPQEDRDYFTSLAAHMMELNARVTRGEQPQKVIADAEAEAALREHLKLCDAKYNEEQDSGIAAIWGDTHLKVLKLTALQAVVEYYGFPIMTLPQVQWSIWFVHESNRLFLEKFDTGDIGQGDADREKKVIHVCHKYLNLDDKDVPQQFRKLEHLRKAGIIPKSYIRQNTRTDAFTKHRSGDKAALDIAIKVAIENQSLMEIPKLTLSSEFKYDGPAFRLTA
ncbi:DUF3987 domain-containing protein [Xanthobacter tagetidis]|nr:DUF3987 domain-containing protein [Xanthobacter tagetidis]MBB6307291.1 hypothetical protein [Xanthobacter tagetidis]